MTYNLTVQLSASELSSVHPSESVSLRSISILSFNSPLGKINVVPSRLSFRATYAAHLATLDLMALTVLGWVQVAQKASRYGVQGHTCRVAAAIVKEQSRTANTGVFFHCELGHGTVIHPVTSRLRDVTQSYKWVSFLIQTPSLYLPKTKEQKTKTTVSGRIVPH